jgi:hypothetical protein
VAAGRPEAACVEKGAGAQQPGPLPPAGPAVGLLQLEEPWRVPLVAGVALVPVLHGGHDLFHTCDIAPVFGKVIDERGVEHVPGSVPVHFGNAVAMDPPATHLEAGMAGEHGDVGAGHATKRVAVDVEDLNRVEDRPLMLEELVRGRILVLKHHRAAPGGQSLLPRTHARAQKGLLPGLEAGNVRHFVGNDLDMGDDADVRIDVSLGVQGGQSD